ncbi:pentatricopeptide repeat-containing protein At5g61990, mitochondrial-like [Rhizophagus clarus]|nr:pentatricopeptide repeat-containing protein At5g61990, mitochondrial-like [Rhizophagus clarus]
MTTIKENSAKLKIIQNLTSSSNSSVLYYYATYSTLTAIGKEQEKNEEKVLLETNNERNTNIEENGIDSSWAGNHSSDGLVIRFREAIQEGNLKKLMMAHHALIKEQKGRQWQSHLKKSDYQDAIRLLSRFANFTQKATNPSPSTQTLASTTSVIYSLFNDMKKQGYKPDTSTYNRLIYMNSLKGDTKESRRIYEMMFEDKIKCTLYTFNSLILSYQWSLDIESALKVLEEMKLYGIKPDTVTLNSLIDIYVKLGDINQAERIYEEMKSNSTARMGNSLDKCDVIVDKFTLDCLLSGYLYYGHLNKAKNLFKDIKDSGIELDIHLYTKLLKIYCYEPGNSQKILNLFSQIKQHQQQEGNMKYFVNTLLDYLIKEKEFSNAVRVYEELMDIGFIHDVVTLTSIIPAYYHTGNVDIAFKLFNEKMNSFLCSQKIFSLFSNLGKKHSKKFLKQFASSSSKLHNSLITYFLTQDDITNALEMYSHLLQQGYFLNILNITILCKKLILQDKINEALQIYYQSKDHNIILDQRGYTILIDSFSKMTYMSESQRIFADMKEKGIKPNSYTYSSLIRGLGKIYDIQGVKTIHQLIRMDLNLDEFDIVIYNSLMDAYNRCGYGYDVLQLWDSLVIFSKESDLLVNNATVSIVLDSCGFNKQLFRLNQIWYDLKKRNFNLNQNNYASYIEALARNQKFNEAKKVLMFEMIDDGILPNSKMIRTLLSFLHDHSKNREQYEIINWVRTNFPFLAKELNLVNKKSNENITKSTSEKN